MYTLPSGLPEKTLGWEILEWGSTYLAQPDGEHAGEMWKYTSEQARFILWFYAVDEFGKFKYRRALLMRPKGHGKSPLLAAICSTELVGPVRFAGWDANGEPVGKPVPTPHVQLCAVSAAQTDNTMSLIIEMCGQGLVVDEYGLDIGKTRILSPKGKIEPVTANAKSREGQRPTFAVLDEPHLWVESNGGIQLANTIRRNLGKVSGRSIETTNAHIPGHGSVAENSFLYWEKIKDGIIDDPSFLFDSRFAPLDTPVEPCPARRAGLLEAYGDAAMENGGWVDLDRIEQEIDDPATTESDARRFYFNQVVKGSDQWMDPEKWKRQGAVKEIAKRDKIALGFDGSIRLDSTALVACRLSDGHIWPIKVWERPENVKEWEVPFLEVDEVVRKTFEDYNVVWMYADPAYWQDIVGRWSLDFEDKVFEFWTHRKQAMSQAIERFETGIYTGQFTYSNLPEHEVLSRHVLNAHIEEYPQAKLLKKEFPMSHRKIDTAMAAILALEARADAIEDGRLKPASSNTIYSF